MGICAAGGGQGRAFPGATRSPTTPPSSPATSGKGSFRRSIRGADGYVGTAPAGAYAPNGYGLFNMVGKHLGVVRRCLPRALARPRRQSPQRAGASCRRAPAQGRLISVPSLLLLSLSHRRAHRRQRRQLDRTRRLPSRIRRLARPRITATKRKRTSMRPANLVVIMSDEHHPRAMGVGGPSLRLHAQPRSPGGARHALRRRLLQFAHLRALARLLCHRPLRARARHLGQCHRLRRPRSGLGPRPAADRPSGRFDRQAALPQRRRPDGLRPPVSPMHIYGGHGMVWGALRDGKADFTERAHMMLDPIGPGTSKYNIYDDLIATEAETWLARARGREPRPALGAVRRVRGAAFSADAAKGYSRPLSHRKNATAASSPKAWSPPASLAGGLPPHASGR